MDDLHARRRGCGDDRPATSPAGRRLRAQGRFGLQHPVRPRAADVHRPGLDRASAAIGPLVRPGAVPADVSLSAPAVPLSRMGPAVLFPGKPGWLRRGAGGAGTGPLGPASPRTVARRDAALAFHAVDRQVRAVLAGEIADAPRAARRADCQPAAATAQGGRFGLGPPAPQRLVRLYARLQLQRTRRAGQEVARPGIPVADAAPAGPRSRLQHGRLQPLGGRVRGRGGRGGLRPGCRGSALSAAALRSPPQSCRWLPTWAAPVPRWGS